DAECQQRGRVARELVVDPHRPSWNKSVAGDHPAGGGECGETQQPEQGPVLRGPTLRCERKCLAAGPDAEQGEELEDGPEPEPKDESASVAAEGGRNRQPAPPAACEEIDRRDQEREQRRNQDELDRPTADHPRAKVDVARGSLHELCALVESAQELLGTAADLSEAAAVETSGGVRERRRVLIARCGQ